MFIKENILEKNNIKILNYYDLIIFLIPLIIFSYYLYVYNPGIICYDSFDQLNQIATNNFRNWHPFFHTFIEMLCLKIYANPITICVLQILTFSSIWMIICKYNRDDDRLNKQVILQIILTLIISLIPMNAVYSITLLKDILFSYLIMFLCFLIKVVLDKKGNLDYKFIFVFSLIMAFIWQLRPNGFFVIILMLIVLGIYFLKKDKPKTFSLIIGLTLVFVILIASLNVIYNVEDDQKDGLYTKTSHILSYYDLNVPMDKEDQEIVHKLISEKDIKEKFNIYFSDPVYIASNKSVYDSNKGEYIGLAIKYSLKHPKKFIKYFFESSAIVWDITRDDDWVGSEYYTYVDPHDYYERKHKTPTASFEKITIINKGTDQYNQLESYVKYFKENYILNIFVNSPALYMYLSIILMVIIHFLTKSKDIYFVYLPNLFVILSILLTTPIQDNRYLYGNFLVFYLLLIILIGTKYKIKKIH